ncbi:MAG: hypothetical protein ACOVQA_07495, partial [Thermoflexibacteraceae bacterium]
MNQKIVLIMLLFSTMTQLLCISSIKSQTLTTCPTINITNVSRLQNIKKLGTDFYITEASPNGTTAGNVIKVTSAGVKSLVFAGMDFPVGLEVHPTTGML